MAAPVVVAAAAAGNTGTLSAGVVSSTLYTCPAGTTARICALTVDAYESGIANSVFSLMIDSKKAIEFSWQDTFSILSVRDKFLYLTAGDTLKIRNDAGSNVNFDYYFSILEQT